MTAAVPSLSGGSWDAAGASVVASVVVASVAELIGARRDPALSGHVEPRGAVRVMLRLHRIW
jgi:hypothetical protein